MENGTKTTTESAVAAGGSTVVVHSIGPHPEPCPSCGRCPTCGRGGYQTMPVYPYYPWWQAPSPYHPHVTWTTYGGGGGTSYGSGGGGGTTFGS